MRVLFTSTPAYGHLQPMLPLAGAFKNAGDTVAVAVAAELCARVQAAGFTALPAGEGMAAWWQELVRRQPDQPWNALLPEQILDWFIPHLFGEVGAGAMLAQLLPAVREWRPDLLIHETYAFAGPISAAVAGVRSVHHTVSPLPSAVTMRLSGEAVAPLWREHGLAEDPFAAMERELMLDICPPSLRNPAATPALALAPLRPVPVPAVGDERLPASLAGLPAQPTVHLTIGTALTNADQTVLTTILEGVREHPLNIVVTVGPNHDTAALGAQPANVHVEQYVPHALLLPRCSAVICHGGAGTMLAALSHGLPLLIVPQGADQYLNAALCSARGVARTLRTGDLTARRAGSELRELLDNPSYRAAASEVQREIAAMPPPAEVVRRLHYDGGHE